MPLEAPAIRVQPLTGTLDGRDPVEWGSTPKSRTVMKELGTPHLAWRLFAASSGCGTARRIRTHQFLLHRVSGNSPRQARPPRHQVQSVAAIAQQDESGSGPAGAAR